MKIKFSLNKSSIQNGSNNKNLFKIQSPVTSEISISDNFAYEQYTIFNANAAIIEQGKKTSPINVQNLPNGMYFLLLKQGLIQYKYKFIKM